MSLTAGRAHRRGKSAFTLVELLVVIGIIALLISILLPALSRVQAAARQTKCLAILRQFGHANAQYMGEYKDWNMPLRWGWSKSNPPAPPNAPPPVPPSGPSRSWANNYALGRFFSSRNPENARFPRDAICPDATNAFSIAGVNDVNGFAITLSYGMNTQQLNQGFPLNADTVRGNTGAPHYMSGWRRQMVLSGAEKIQFIDAISNVNAGGSPPYTTRYFLPGWGEIYVPDPTGANTKSNIVAYRHARGANVLYYDGHATWLPYDMLKHDPADPSTAPNKRQWEPRTR